MGYVDGEECMLDLKKRTVSSARIKEMCPKLAAQIFMATDLIAARFLQWVTDFVLIIWGCRRCFDLLPNMKDMPALFAAHAIGEALPDVMVARSALLPNLESRRRLVAIEENKGLSSPFCTRLASFGEDDC
ncbi:hypothetical protein ACLOJK_019483 [Asimina triloba]